MRNRARAHGRQVGVLVDRRGDVQHVMVGDARGIELPEPAYSATPADNRHFDTGVLRYHYESLVTPPSVYDYDMASGEKTLMKRDEVGGGYDPAEYTTERLYARARDGMVSRHRPTPSPSIQMHTFSTSVIKGATSSP